MREMPLPIISKKLFTVQKETKLRWLLFQLLSILFVKQWMSAYFFSSSTFDLFRFIVSNFLEVFGRMQLKNLDSFQGETKGLGKGSVYGPQGGDQELWRKGSRRHARYVALHVDIISILQIYQLNRKLATINVKSATKL